MELFLSGWIHLTAAEILSDIFTDDVGPNQNSIDYRPQIVYDFGLVILFLIDWDGMTIFVALNVRKLQAVPDKIKKKV